MSLKLVSRGVKCWVWALCAVLVLAWPAPARAQMGMGGPMMGAMQLSKRGLTAYGKLLGLDKDQMNTAKELLEGSQAASKHLQKDMESQMQSLQEKAQDDGWQVYQKEMPKIMKDFQEKSEANEKQFFDDLRALLTPAQEDKWVKVERYRRRETLLRWSISSGMAVDLIDALEKAKVDPSKDPQLAEIADQYEAAVDRALVTFKKVGEDAQKKQMDMMANFDPKAIEDMVKPVQDSAKAIRDLNRDYARRMSPLLPEEARAAFDMEIKRRTFPRIYKEAHPTKAIEAALKFSDLDASQKESLTALRESYAKDAAAANDKWAAAMEEKENKAGGKISMMMQTWTGGGESDDSLKQARDARKDLDKKTEERIASILKPDQKDRLPKKEPENNGWDMFDLDVMGGQDPDKE